MRRKRKAVLFDLYGTLADIKVDEQTKSFWNRLVARSLLRNSPLTGDKLRSLYFSTAENEIENGGEEGSVLPATFRRLLAESGNKSDENAIRSFARVFRKESLILLKERSYTRSILNAVKAAGYGTGLISNTEALLTDYDLEQLQIKPFFDFICLSSQTGVKKPDPRIFEKTLSDLGVGSSEAVFIGDDFEADVRGATDAGLDVVFLSEGDKPSQSISNRKGAVVIQCKAAAQNIAEALSVLGLEIGDHVGPTIKGARRPIESETGGETGSRLNS